MSCKKTLCLVMIVLLLAGLSSCNEKSTYGKINEVEIDQEKIAYEEENVFNLVSDDLGYEYESIDNRRAYMKFDAPKGWKVKIHNARHIELTAPSDDPLLASQTMHVMYDYAIANENADTPGMYGKIFENDLGTLDYNVYGGKYTQSYYMSPTSLETDITFSKRPDMLSLEYIEDVQVKKMSTGSYPKGKCDALYYYVKWANYPTAFMCVCEQENTETVRRLLRYMVSSITYTRPTLAATQNISIKNIKFPLPSTFKLRENTDNIYQVPIDNLGGLSGMAIGVYHAEKEITPEAYQFSYAESIGNSFLPGYGKGYDNVYSCNPQVEKVSFGNRQVEKFIATCTIMPKKNTSGQYYTAGQTWYMTNYVFPDEREGGWTIICLWYQDSQKALGDQLARQLETNAEIRN